MELPVAGTDEKIVLHPSKIVAVGLNYAAHVDESASFDQALAELPPEPVLFAKTPNVLVSNDAPIVLPALVLEYGFEEPRTDLEAELAVVISRRARNVRADEAYDYVLGYTCFNDISQRNIQMGDVSGWFRGKCFDTFGPIGPSLVRAADLTDPQSLSIAARINGRTVQEASTSQMIFDIPTLLAYISRFCTLEAGDIIATGTPSGVSPIVAGDVVEVEIEGIGVLRNPVIEEGDC